MASCAIALASFASRADAAPSDPQKHETAVRLFSESRTEYRDGHFQRAVDLLLEARSIEPAPVLLYNLARAYEGLGDFPRAVESYASYLKEEPQAVDRGAIEERIRTLQHQLDERAELERGRKDAERKQREHERERPAAPPPPPPSVVPWIVAGAGVAAVGTGVVLGILARSDHDASTRQRVQSTSFDEQQSALHRATAANVLYVAGGIIAAGGVVWGVLDLRAARAKKQERVAFDFGPGQVVARGVF